MAASESRKGHQILQSSSYAPSVHRMDMESIANYEWHHQHFEALCNEYTHRYGKVHNTEKLLLEDLIDPPENIPDVPMTQFKLAMKSTPECMHPEDPVRSYHEFYQTKQARFKMTWTKRAIPEWFKVK